MLERKIDKPVNNNESQNDLLRKIINTILRDAEEKNPRNYSYKETFKFLFGDKYLFLVDIFHLMSGKTPVIHEAGDTLNRLLLEAFKKNVLAGNNDAGDSKSVDNSNNDTQPINTISLLQAISRFLKVRLVISSAQTPYDIGESHLPILTVRLKDSPPLAVKIKANETSSNKSLSLSPLTHQTAQPACNLDTLPSDIHETIAGFFSALEIARIASVSKQWRKTPYLPSSQAHIVEHFTHDKKALYYYSVYLKNPTLLKMLANFKFSLPLEAQYLPSPSPLVDAERNTLFEMITQRDTLSTLPEYKSLNFNCLDNLMVSPLLLAAILEKSQIIDDLKKRNAMILPQVDRSIIAIKNYCLFWFNFLEKNSTNENDTKMIVHILNILSPYINFRDPMANFTLAHRVIYMSIAEDLPTIDIIKNILEKIKETKTNHVPKYYLDRYHVRQGSLILAGLINFNKKKSGKHSEEIIDLYLSYFPLSSNELRIHLAQAAIKSPNLLKPFFARYPDKCKAEIKSKDTTKLNKDKKEDNLPLVVHDAAKLNCSSSVKYLVSQGADLLDRDPFDNTVLHTLANMNYLFDPARYPKKFEEFSYADNFDFVNYLLYLNDINIETIKQSGKNRFDQTLWHIAAKSHSYPILMLPWQQDINARDQNGNTPLELALNHSLADAPTSGSRMFPTIVALLALKADIYVLGYNKKPLKDKLDHAFSEMLSRGIIGPNKFIPTTSMDGRSITTPLVHFAITHALMKTVSTILSHDNFDHLMCDESGRTPLFYACELAAKTGSNAGLRNTLDVIASNAVSINTWDSSDVLFLGGIALSMYSRQSVVIETNPGDSKAADRDWWNDPILNKKITDLFKKTTIIINDRVSTISEDKAFTVDKFKEMQQNIEDALNQTLLSATPTLLNQNALRLFIKTFQSDMEKLIKTNPPLESKDLFPRCVPTLLMFRSKLMLAAPNHKEIIAALKDIIIKLKHAIYIANMNTTQNTINSSASHRPTKT